MCQRDHLVLKTGKKILTSPKRIVACEMEAIMALGIQVKYSRMAHKKLITV